MLSATVSGAGLKREEYGDHDHDDERTVAGKPVTTETKSASGHSLTQSNAPRQVAGGAAYQFRGAGAATARA